MLNYAKMNSLIESLSEAINKLYVIFPMEVVRRLWLLAMTSLAGCDCVNNETGKEERETLTRTYRAARAEFGPILQMIDSLSDELESLYEQNERFVTEDPIWLFAENPHLPYGTYDFRAVERLHRAFALECLRSGILSLHSESGGTCGAAEYNLSYVYDLVYCDLPDFVRAYESLDGVAMTCLEPGLEQPEGYSFDGASAVKARHETARMRLDDLKNGLKGAAVLAEQYRQQVCAMCAS